MFNRHDVENARVKWPGWESRLERAILDAQEKRERRWNRFVNTAVACAVVTLTYISVSSARLPQKQNSPENKSPKQLIDSIYYANLTTENELYARYIKESNSTQRLCDSSYNAFVDAAWKRNFKVLEDDNPFNDTIYPAKEMIPCVKRATVKYNAIMSGLNADKENARKVHEKRIDAMQKGYRMYINNLKKNQRMERRYAKREYALKISGGR